MKADQDKVVKDLSDLELLKETEKKKIEEEKRRLKRDKLMLDKEKKDQLKGDAAYYLLQFSF